GLAPTGAAAAFATRDPIAHEALGSLVAIATLAVALSVAAQPAPTVVPSASAAVVTSVAGAPPAVAAKVKPGSAARESLPAPALPAWLATPTPSGLWTFRIDNQGTRPARVPADVRALHIEIEHFEGKRRTVTKCTLPAALEAKAFPERRGLL